MKHYVVRNVGTGPVVVSEHGHSVLPGDWQACRETPELLAAIEAGTLLDRTDQITEKSDEQAWAAKQDALSFERIDGIIERNLQPVSPTTMSGGDASSPDAEQAAATE